MRERIFIGLLGIAAIGVACFGCTGTLKVGESKLRSFVMPTTGQGDDKSSEIGYLHADLKSADLAWEVSGQVGVAGGASVNGFTVDYKFDPVKATKSIIDSASATFGGLLGMAPEG